jgi:hypothetical protein
MSYLLSALVAAVLLPGFVYLLMTVALPGLIYSQVHATEATVVLNVSSWGQNAFELIRGNQDTFAPDQISLHELANMAEDNLVNR